MHFEEFKLGGKKNRYLKTTTIPSNTLNPLLMYPKGPSAIILSNISAANTAENAMLLISTSTVNSSGWKYLIYYYGVHYLIKYKKDGININFYFSQM